MRAGALAVHAKPGNPRDPAFDEEARELVRQVKAMSQVKVVLADWSATGLKALFDRPRPPLRYAEPKTLVHLPHDASFPSGHAATSFAAATMLSFAVPRFAPFLYVLAAAVAFSRVYVGVHYPLDVLGGALLGVLIAAGLKLLISRRARGRLKPSE